MEVFTPIPEVFDEKAEKLFQQMIDALKEGIFVHLPEKTYTTLQVVGDTPQTLSYKNIRRDTSNKHFSPKIAQIAEVKIDKLILTNPKKFDIDFNNDPTMEELILDLRGGGVVEVFVVIIAFVAFMKFYGAEAFLQIQNPMPCAMVGINLVIGLGNWVMVELLIYSGLSITIKTGKFSLKVLGKHHIRVEVMAWLYCVAVFANTYVVKPCII